MSYILDALKRAESERERGSIPGLHSQQVLAGAASPGPGPASWLWPTAGASAVLLGALALYLFAPVALKLSPQGVATSPLPTPAPAALPAPQINAVTAVAETPRAAPPEVDAESAAARASRRAQRAAAAEARAKPRDDGPASQGPAKASEARVYALNELPENIRLELPRVVVGGSSYSTNPALRMLMINGQMYQEREQPLPNLQLEQIRQGSAVLKYKGYRYRITY